MQKTKKREGKAVIKTFSLGAKVVVRVGDRRVRGVIVEDRGRIGVGGRQLYRIAFTKEPQTFMELGAEELRPV